MSPFPSIASSLESPSPSSSSPAPETHAAAFEPYGSGYMYRAVRFVLAHLLMTDVSRCEGGDGAAVAVVGVVKE